MMVTMVDEGLRAEREKIVLDHFQNEVRQDWDATLSTFPHPHYEIVATGAVHDGDGEVRRYYHDTRIAFPDQRHELISLRHADDAVVCEFHLLGTHRGPFGAIPPTGQTFTVRMTAFFLFQGEELVCERVYFDALTMLRQLLRGRSPKNPRNWPFLVKVLRGIRRELG